MAMAGILHRSRTSKHVWALIDSSSFHLSVAIDATMNVTIELTAMAYSYETAEAKQQMKSEELNCVQAKEAASPVTLHRPPQCRT